MRKTVYSFALALILCLSAWPQSPSGTIRGPSFDPFPIGANWTMTSVLTGYTTVFTVNALSAQTSYSCFTPAASSMMVDLNISKTQTATYWNPGSAQNVDEYIFKSAAWGPIVFMEIASSSTTPFAAQQTTYFFGAPGLPPYGQLLFSTATNWAKIQDSSGTNVCKTAPTSYPETYGVAVTQESRTTPLWTGAVNCYLYTANTTTQSQEKWCFAADPKLRFPTILVEIDDLVSNGTSSTLKLQTTQITAF